MTTVQILEPTASIERNGIDEKVGAHTPTPKTASQKKLRRQRRLELGPSSSSPHGQGLPNAYLTSEIGTLGQKLLYMSQNY